MSYIYEPRDDYEKKILKEYDKLNKRKYEDKYRNFDVSQLYRDITSEDVFIRICMRERNLKRKIVFIIITIISILMYLFLSINVYHASNSPLQYLFVFGIVLFTCLLYLKIREINIKYKHYDLIDFSALNVLEDIKNTRCTEIKKEFFEDL
ncbi:hypothetical protein QJL30_10140 [Clostridioides difficile]|uniref:Uncharacterized protein n=1 Tax=Clostridioides difficile TaxID=1496 RepID=A0A386JBY3_CLODI|nr:hypothetical protein [Clostridioides difficile]EQF26880.1 hypothetical protein QEW_0979 [Clostridioides difficile CD160]AYD68688.1 hypothetical protein pHSJD-312_00067 [Clostridioides difficile]MDI2882318.1 hypothetical protein [Clostridioides difficile]MDI3004299.1 hypothetical protein [Clostridioides difficile]MDN9956196.1 hypothetical protein [Clostridioides difficile]